MATTSPVCFRYTVCAVMNAPFADASLLRHDLGHRGGAANAVARVDGLEVLDVDVGDNTPGAVGR